MKRKYPKTKGMAVIFEKQRFNRALDTDVYREIHRRHLRGEKVSRIIDDMIHGETYGSKMTHKDEESWRKGYYKKHPRGSKSVATVNCEFNPINIGRNAPSKSFIRKHETILPVQRQCVKNRDSRSDLLSQNFDTSPQVHHERYYEKTEKHT